MKRLIVAFAFSAAAIAFGAQAQTAPAAKNLTPQQQRMADCNKQATGMKGDERKKFMSGCLSGKAPAASTAVAAPATATAAKPASQQDKMKSCNADAGSKNLKGDERKKFMSGCLSGKAPAASTAVAAPATATAAKPASQQDKMKSCNADAGSKNLKGDERKKFMSDCLKKGSK